MADSSSSHNEAETRTALITPRIEEAGWGNEPHGVDEEYYFTDGRIHIGSTPYRGDRRYADYLLRHRYDFPIAVVEAKAEGAKTGLQQAKDYADMLGLPFAFATDGHWIREFDALTGTESERAAFPSPDELFRRYTEAENLPDDARAPLLHPYKSFPEITPRYYQYDAINRAVKEILKGRKRLLLTMATGTGKTFVAFMICWKLWNGGWTRTGDPVKRPKILFLADREDLVDSPMAKRFAPFGEARHKIESGNVVQSREMYFALYQGISGDVNREGLFKEYDPDFFDLIVVDECHRGSARDDSTWRKILERFDSAVQLGMTATPRREDNRDTYRYFGSPLVQYSLKQGIEDGFLAPYRVHSVRTDVDIDGWRPDPGQRDRYGETIPDGLYGTREFEKQLSLKPRSEAIARHLSDYLQRTNRYAKTIVFCVDQEHARSMRTAINNLNTDLVAQHPNYVCRITSDEGATGKLRLSEFKDVEATTPVVVTTSKMLTTGIDAPTCENIVIARVVGTMSEFKQIIGRGTRVREEYGKMSFTIIDYTGSATEHFADPDFDGYPASLTEEQMDETGDVTASVTRDCDDDGTLSDPNEASTLDDSQPASDASPEDEGTDDTPRRRKFYVDNGYVEVVREVVHRYDSDGTPLAVSKITDYTGEQVRTLYADSDALRAKWADPDRRPEVIKALKERGIPLDELSEEIGQPTADPFDLLCHLAYNEPIRTRRERAQRLRREERDFFDRYGEEARVVLHDLIDKYTAHGPAQLVVPDILKVPPLSNRGSTSEIVAPFGDTERFRNAFKRLQSLIYAEK